MKTKELIESLQQLDPSGELEVVANGIPIYFAEKQEAYYDGDLQILILDENKKPYYCIQGMKITNKGYKIKLHTMDLESVLCEDEKCEIDLSELPDNKQKMWQEKIKNIFQDPLAIMEQAENKAEENLNKNLEEDSNAWEFSTD